MLILFLFLVFSFTLSITNETYATCPGGYCYDDGTNAQGGSCGSSTSTIWWDTCFGLSWQYYEWPVGHVGNIKIHGTANSGGDATIDAQCAEYGGFWFLGYEAYNPSIGTSLGYQIAKPKVSMLKSTVASLLFSLIVAQIIQVVFIRHRTHILRRRVSLVVDTEMRMKLNPSSMLI